jgi:hypothetical protein
MFKYRIPDERPSRQTTRGVKKNGKKESDKINNTLFIQYELRKLYTPIYNLPQDC